MTSEDIKHQLIIIKKKMLEDFHRVLRYAPSRSHARTNALMHSLSLSLENTGVDLLVVLYACVHGCCQVCLTGEYIYATGSHHFMSEPVWPSGKALGW